MNEITKVPNISIQTMDDVERAARAMSASKFFPDSVEMAKAVVKILAGQELGFGAFASMTGVSVIQGKPVVGANLTAAAIKRTGKYNYRVVEHTDQVCKIKFLENGEEVGISSFSMEDAKAAGLTGKDNWKKYPRNMLFARALSNGQKWYAPDVYNGATVYTPDEMGATVNEDGEIVEVKAIDAQPEKSHREKLVERYTDLMAKAALKGIDVSAWNITDNMTDDEITALGKSLKAELEK